MYDYISGKIASATATQVVIDCGGVGYLMEVTLATYTQLKDSENAKLWIHEVIREDAHLLYGFASEGEREMFRLLLSVNGVGSATARIMLSSLSVNELSSAIVNGNTKTVQQVKGIGTKTAQRIILELKDKVASSGMASNEDGSPTVSARRPMSSEKSDAQAALVMLGFPRPSVEKVLKDIDDNMSVDQMMKLAMQRL